MPIDILGLGPEARLELYNVLLGDDSDVSTIGSWEWDPVTDVCLWSNNTFRLLGVQPHTCVASPIELMKRIHPEDLPGFQQQTAAAAESANAPPLEYRVVWDDGTVRHLRARGREIRSESGATVRMIGTVTDITAEREPLVATDFDADAEIAQRMARRVRLFELAGGGGGYAVFQGRKRQLSCLQYDLLRLLLDRVRDEADVDDSIRGFVKSVELAVVLPWETANPSAASIKQAIRRLRSALRDTRLCVESRRGFGYRIWFAQDG